MLRKTKLILMPYAGSEYFIISFCFDIFEDNIVNCEKCIVILKTQGTIFFIKWMLVDSKEKLCSSVFPLIAFSAPGLILWIKEWIHQQLISTHAVKCPK